ncbi:hemolysin family protein [Clostridium sp. DJ247]|uniref:hemolysin family protein n=1 Tax=Clostridium sp. DJ247 TaxID=2726188 RepID=UPI0016299183|nr:hemolysin family protein [Clostridium sp. DJ247]MBC2582459.1 HlyC/CorC family transporter [Clostridium sp. DJ247]
MESEPESILLELLLILFLTLLNAFFSASEMAIVSINRAKISHLASEGNKKAVSLLKLLDEPSKFLATIQVGITLAGFLASASAATSISKPLARLFREISIPITDKIAMVLVTVLLAYITLVLGELLPKRIALQNSQTIAMIAVTPILFISKIALPFIKILTASTNFLMRIFDIDAKEIEEKVSEEEIRMMISVGEENGVINETEKEMIDGIFEFDNMLAREIMTPRTSVFAINVNMPIRELISNVLEKKFSRIPVYEDDIDNIVGIIYMKDLFAKMAKDNLNQQTIRSILRSAYFVPETKNTDVLFRELQATKNHMAVLIDEYGGFSGIVTMEDLIEEIVGNIFDEYDELNNEVIKKVDTNTYVVDGLVLIDDINETLHVNLPSDNYDTVGGFVVDLLGSIPDECKEYTIEYENLIFKVEEVEEKRISKLKICVA